MDDLILEAKQQFAPDRRTVVFDVTTRVTGQNVVVSGEIHDVHLKNVLMDYLTSRTDLRIVDSITVLPEASLDGKTFGVVNVSVGNLRGSPAHSSELVTQVLLGTPLKVLKQKGGWYYVQTPNDYLGWMDGGFERMKKEEYDRWASSPKAMVTAVFGFTLRSKKNSDQVISDVVIGNLLKLIDQSGTHYRVEYPDGRVAFLSKEDGVPYSKWIAKANDTPDNIISTAKRFFGVPYLWGGTSSKGMDCSGYTSTVFYLNGVLLPRDASQQVLVGEPIDGSENLENLRLGDLLFFGAKATQEKKERVTHVGIYLGENRFIHASTDVRINSLNPDDPDYSKYRHETYLRAKRIIGAGPMSGVKHLAELPYYKSHEL